MENLQISRAFLDDLSKDEGLKQKFIENPEKVLKDNANPLATDKWIYRSVVWALGAVLILCLIFSFALVYNGKTADIPQVIVSMGSMALGALAGLLAPSPRERS
jgi:predicted phage tail protein